MRLSCPSCQTEYDVPDAALTGRTRMLRCAACGNQWQAGPLAAEPSPPPPKLPPPPEPPTAAELEYAQRPRVTAASTYAAPSAGLQPTAPSFTYAEEPPAPSRAAPAPYDPAEARHQADRDSFAALLEASRQSNAQIPETPDKSSRASMGRPNPWLVSILVLLLLIGLVVLERGHIMAVWPPSARLFDALGLGSK